MEKDGAQEVPDIEYKEYIRYLLCKINDPNTTNFLGCVESLLNSRYGIPEFDKMRIGAIRKIVSKRNVDSNTLFNCVYFLEELVNGYYNNPNPNLIELNKRRIEVLYQIINHRKVDIEILEYCAESLNKILKSYSENPEVVGLIYYVTKSRPEFLNMVLQSNCERFSFLSDSLRRIPIEELNAFELPAVPSAPRAETLPSAAPTPTAARTQVRAALVPLPPRTSSPEPRVEAFSGATAGAGATSIRTSSRNNSILKTRNSEHNSSNAL